MSISVPLSMRYFTIFRHSPFLAATCRGAIWWRERQYKTKPETNPDVMYSVQLRHAQLFLRFKSCACVVFWNLCSVKYESGWEAGYLVNAHTAVVSVVQLARKKIAENSHSSQEQNSYDIWTSFFYCCLDHCGLYSGLWLMFSQSDVCFHLGVSVSLLF